MSGIFEKGSVLGIDPQDAAEVAENTAEQIAEQASQTQNAARGLLQSLPATSPDILPPISQQSLWNIALLGLAGLGLAYVLIKR